MQFEMEDTSTYTKLNLCKALQVHNSSRPDGKKKKKNATCHQESAPFTYGTKVAANLHWQQEKKFPTPLTWN